jgi:hypothetical protein
MTAIDQPKSNMPQRHLRLGIDAAYIPVFFELLRNGFSADLTVGCSLEHLLCNQLDIAPDYLYSRVQTVFLNNSPLDDLASTVVPDGAVISLSAAMPGLNGAMMRRGGLLAGLRSSISHSPDEACLQPFAGRITIKLFNLVAKELGPHFLARGIVVNSKDLNELLSRHAPDIGQRVKTCEIDGVSSAFNDVTLQDWPEQGILLQVQSS